MSFQTPWMFALLLVVAALAATYVFMQLRRQKYAVRFANLDLLSSVAPKRPGWRRHVPAAVVGAGLIFMIVGLAQPVHETPVANESRIVMLAIDVSGSMEATDVTPTRLQAAQTAAEDFVDSLPEGYEVGLVSFSDEATLDVAPTLNHAAVNQAISQLQAQGSTASGDAIIASLQAIKVARNAAGVTTDGNKSAAIVMLSDGDQKVGVTLDVASQAAAKMGVPVSTITFGTASGQVTVQGYTIPVPPDPQAMAAVAQATGGKTFDAASASELKQVYQQIQGDVGVTNQTSPLWPWFIAFAFILLVAACAAAFIWTSRFL